MGDLQPFDFFRQESSHTDVVIRTEAMMKVVLICALMGPEKVRSEMIPYLGTRMTDLDQVLLALGSKLADMLPYVGGPEEAHALVPLLESLCNIEEITIRTATATSAGKIISNLGPSHTKSITAFFELFKALSNDESGELFYGRVAACPMVPQLYGALPVADRPALREIYSKLIVDELAMVRRMAGRSFLEFTSFAEPEVIEEELVGTMLSMAADEHASVKVVAAEIIAEFCEKAKQSNVTSEKMTELLKVVRQFTEDPSWKIRLNISKNFKLFATSFADEDITTDILPGLMGLVQDMEPDVRIASLETVPLFVQAAGATAFLAEFSPVTGLLVEDPMPQVRKILAEVCIDVAAMVGVEPATPVIIPIIIRLIGDEDPLVRLRVLKKLHKIAQELPSLFPRLTEPLKTMFKDTNWRVRQTLAMEMPAVVKHLGTEYFMENFLSDFLVLLKDGVDEVRVGSSATLGKFVDAAGSQWVFEKLFPTVQSMARDEFMVRMAMLTALERLLEIDIHERFQLDVLNLVGESSRDKVVNIRIRVAQVLGTACTPLGPERSRSIVRPILSELQNDKDKDVKYFSTQAMRACG